MESIYDLDFILAQQSKNAVDRKQAQLKLYNYQLEKKDDANKLNLNEKNLQIISSNAIRPPSVKRPIETEKEMEKEKCYSKDLAPKEQRRVLNSNCDNNTPAIEVEEKIIAEEEPPTMVRSENGEPNKGVIFVNKKFNIKDLLI